MKRFLVALALLAAALLSAGCGRSTQVRGKWMWWNPTPTGNVLNAVDVVDDTHGWAVGDRGTIVWTADGIDGATQYSGTVQDLTGVSMASTQTGFAVGEGGVILGTTNGGRTWTTASSGTSVAFRAVDAVDAKHAFAVGESGLVRKTVDGSSWTSVNPGYYNHLYAVDAVNANVCWAGGASGTILYTSNGGLSWVKKSTGIPVSETVTDIRFVNSSVGWATTKYGTSSIPHGRVYRTTNGGNTWVMRKDIDTWVYGVATSGTAEAWITGGWEIAHTTDGGATWPEWSEAPKAEVIDVDFKNGTGAATDARGRVMMNMDGTWAYAPVLLAGPTPALPIHDLAESNGVVYAASEDGNLLRSDTLWGTRRFVVAQALPTYVDLLCVDFADSDSTKGWVGTDLGRVWKTVDSGTSWSQIATITGMRIEEIEFVDANNGLVAGLLGTDGVVLGTNNGGTSWNNTALWPGQSLTDFALPSTNYLYAIAGRGFFSWRDSVVTTRTVGTKQLNGVDFPTVNTGFVCGEDGVAYRTTNGGASWTKLNTGTTRDLKDIQFTSTTQGMMTGDGGIVLRTTNGGSSWSQENVGTNNDLDCLWKFSDGADWWVGGEGGSILRWDGLAWTESAAGADRYQTAVQVSQKYFSASSVTTVVVATGQGWPDAIAGSALAGALDCPILLTKPWTLPDEIGDEIDRLGATHAIVLGGATAVNDAVVAQVGVRVGSAARVKRVWGADRYATAAKIAREAVRIHRAKGGTYDRRVLIATGLNWPDALASSPISTHKVEPILLVRPTGAPAATLDAIDDLNANKALILGSDAVVPAAVANQVKTAIGGVTPVRLGGGDRYDTGARIAAWGCDNGMDAQYFGLATGLNFPDALSGGVGIGSRGGLLLLTRPAKLDPFAAKVLDERMEEGGPLYFFGSTDVLPQSVRDEAEWTVRGRTYPEP